MVIRNMKYNILLRSDLLHELLQRVAVRAYERGREDASKGYKDAVPQERVRIHPDHLRKLL